MKLDEPIAARGFQHKHGDRPLDGYTIQRAAGRGGFGEVYYAVSDSGREVALKLVHTYEQIELRGISQCMNLKSPHLVTIFDVKYGEDGRPWVIMEYVAGPSLQELLDAAPSGLGVAKAAFFLREMGKGLTYLHECGIVHRDLKPGNIFYENGYVKIGDYGLSKAMSLTRHSGQTVAVGTLHYMAPEIGEGCYDRGIDIYAMGAVLFEMLTGQVPFFGSSPAEVLMKHLTSDVNLDGIEEPLRSVIRKAMAKNPAERFQSVQEMVEAVYGSDQIRNSVTQFSPESLTMVAGRVAGNVGSGGAANGGAGKAVQRADPGWTTAWHIGNRVARAGQRIKAARGRFRERILGGPFPAHAKWKQGVPGDNESPGAISSGGDAIPLPARIFLALAAASLAAFIVMANAPARTADEQGALVFLSVVGAVIGATLGWRIIAPGLVGESHWFQRFAIGAPAAVGAIVLSVSIWGDKHPARGIREAMLASFLGLLLLQWEKRLAVNRVERFSVGHLITSGIVGLILSGICDADPSTVIAIVAGASLATSLCAARRRQTPGAAAAPAHVPGAAVDRPQMPGPPLSPLISPTAIPSPAINATSPVRARWGNGRGSWIVTSALCLTVFVALAIAAANGRSSRQPVSGAVFPRILFLLFALFVLFLYVLRGGNMSSVDASLTGQYPATRPVTVTGIVSGFARWMLAAVGGLLLLLSLLLALAVVTNFPGLILRGGIDSHMPRDLEYALGPHWPRLLCDIGAAASLVTALAAVMIFLITRRYAGVIHMLRAIFGTGILLGAAIAMGRALPDWSDFPLGSTPGETMDWFFGHVEPPMAVLATIVGAIGIAAIVWPPKRRVQNGQASSVPNN